MSDHIVLRKANNIVDVFHDEQGFNPQGWTRFLLVRGYLKYIKSVQMNNQDLVTVKTMLGV